MITSFPTIMLLKLVNGLDCMGTAVAQVTEAHEVLFTTFTKVRIMIYKEEGQQVHIGFRPFLLPAEDAEIILKDRDILCMVDAPTKITEGYIAATTSLQLARSIPQGGRIIEGKLQ